MLYMTHNLINMFRGRNRFTDDGFDLDLSYITERIIGMLNYLDINTALSSSICSNVISWFWCGVCLQEQFERCS